MDNASATTHSSPDTVVAVAGSISGSASSSSLAPKSQPNPSQRLNRADRPCDTCRRRKSRCSKELGEDRCVLCTFHNRECTYNESPQQRRKKRPAALDDQDDKTGGGSIRKPRKASRATASPEPDVAAFDYPTALAAPNTGKSLLDRTLGLHRTTHFKYIGPSSMHEERLFDIIYANQEPGSDDERSKFRRVAKDATFLSRSDKQTLFDTDVDEDLEAVEQIVRNHGPSLVALYFRTVHPSYPILHKEVFYEKYDRSYKEFSPPLLAAVYLLAMDWWEYDQKLSSYEKPDGEELLRVAMRAMMGAVHRPKLSSVQAGLLLLQRSGGDSWVMTSQVVAVAEELGLHLDCSSWGIPDWEKGLRRRLSWAVYMQDKWGALIHGRPSHAIGSHWQIPRLSLDDFPESAADDDDEEGSTEVEQGRLLFIHLTRLTEIMAQVLDTLYNPDPTRLQALVAAHSIQSLIDLIKPLAVELKQWVTDMPSSLRMEDVKARKLCSNGYLHLARFTTEIVIHRAIVRSLSPATPPQLWHRYREAARDRLVAAIGFIDALRPEHLQAFWWFAAPRSLAFITTYGGLLWATSATHEEAEFYRQKLVDFRWSLKVRARGAGFVAVALREMEESLQDLDMTRSPVGRVPGKVDGTRMVGESTNVKNHTGISSHGAIHAEAHNSETPNALVVAGYDQTLLSDGGGAYAYSEQQMAQFSTMQVQIPPDLAAAAAAVDFDAAELSDFPLGHGQGVDFFFSGT